MVLQPCSGKHISPLRQPGIVDKDGAGENWRGPPASFVTGVASLSPLHCHHPPTDWI